MTCTATPAFSAAIEPVTSAVRDQSATAASAATVVYLVAWTGGWDDPSFASFTDEAVAISEFEAWANSAQDRTDRVTLVEQVITADGVVVNTKVRDYSPGTEDGSDED